VRIGVGVAVGDFEGGNLVGVTVNDDVDENQPVGVVVNVAVRLTGGVKVRRDVAESEPVGEEEGCSGVGVCVGGCIVGVLVVVVGVKVIAAGGWAITLRHNEAGGGIKRRNESAPTNDVKNTAMSTVRIGRL
jgi:hypothetical protein